MYQTAAPEAISFWRFLDAEHVPGSTSVIVDVDLAGDDAHIHLEKLEAAAAPEFVLLEDAQELDLGHGREAADSLDLLSAEIEKRTGKGSELKMWEQEAARRNSPDIRNSAYALDALAASKNIEMLMRRRSFTRTELEVRYHTKLMLFILRAGGQKKWAVSPLTAHIRNLWCLLGFAKYLVDAGAAFGAGAF